MLISSPGRELNRQGSFALVIWERIHRGDIAAQKTGLRCWSPKAPAAARVAASQAILDRAYGRAPTFSTQDPGQFKRAIDMSDDEFAASVARARLHVVK